LRIDSEDIMRRKLLTICEICGGTEPLRAGDFLVFHCLTFCSPDCRDDYRAADKERRAKTETSRPHGPMKTRRSRAA
jgi:hypothetical protein